MKERSSTRRRKRSSYDCTTTKCIVCTGLAKANGGARDFSAALLAARRCCWSGLATGLHYYGDQGPDFSSTNKVHPKARGQVEKNGDLHLALLLDVISPRCHKGSGDSGSLYLPQHLVLENAQPLTRKRALNA